jgi:PAS domain S-box-containing protein
MPVGPEVRADSSSRLGVLLGLLLVLFVVPAMVAQYWLFRREEQAGLLETSLYLAVVFLFLGTVGLAARLVRRQASLDAAVRQSQERYRQLFDSSPLPMWLFDVETLAFLAVNDAAVRHYGYSRAEFLQMTLKDIRPPEDVPAFLERLARGEASVRSGELWRHRKRDGTLIDVEIHSHRVDFAGRPASLVSANDISDRRRAEREVRRSREDLQTLLDSMSTMVATVATDGRLLLVNRMAEAASGLSRAELMNTRFLDGPWWSFDPAVQRRVREAFRRACEGDAVSYDEKIRVFGQVLTISFGLTPVTDSDGRVAYLVAEGRDVTQLKAAEQGLRERSAELEALNHDLEAFTYSVSHDLRAPLRHVAGFARILEEDYGATLDERAGGYLRRIVEGARQMGELIDDLLKLSRLGRRPLERELTELGALVEEARREVEAEGPGRPIDWSVGPLPRLECDRGLVRQVFVNLLSNAVKYSRPRPRSEVEVGARQQDGATVFYVRDNGVGFDMKYAHKLFGVFQRLHGMAQFEGTGIGLATVQRVVQKHGGRAWAEAAVDRGATFYFTLQPARDAPEPSPVTTREKGGEHARRG